MKTIKALAASLLLLLGGCATQIAPETLKTPSPSRQALYFKENFFYPYNEQNIARSSPGDYRGFYAGLYAPEYEDEQGVYYRAVGTCVVFIANAAANVTHAVDGGIWIEKDKPSPRFRLYHYMHSDSSRVLPHSKDNPCMAAKGPKPSDDTGSYDYWKEYLDAKKIEHPNLRRRDIAAGTILGLMMMHGIVTSERGKIAVFTDPPENLSIAGKYVPLDSR